MQRKNKYIIILFIVILSILLTINIKNIISPNKNNRELSNDIENEEELVDIEKENIETLEELVALYEKEEKYDDAVEVYNELLLLDAQNDQYLYSLAICYLEIEEYELALEFLKASDEVKNHQPTTLFLISQVYLLLGEFEHAQQIANDAVAATKIYNTDPQYYAEWSDLVDSFDVKKEEAWVGVIEGLPLNSMKLKASETAIKDYHNANKHPHEHILYKAGLLHNQYGKYDQAIQYFKERINIYPNLKSSYVLLAENYYLTKNISELNALLKMVEENGWILEEKLISAFITSTQGDYETSREGFDNLADTGEYQDIIFSNLTRLSLRFSDHTSAQDYYNTFMGLELKDFSYWQSTVNELSDGIDRMLEIE